MFEIYCQFGDTLDTYAIAGNMKTAWRVAYNYMRMAAQKSLIGLYNFDIIDGHTGEVLLSGFYKKEPTTLYGLYCYTMTLHHWRDHRELEVTSYCPRA